MAETAALTAILTVMAIFLILFVIFRPTPRIIHEGERRVVFRLGRFDRIAGPGINLVLRGIETEQRTFISRNEPRSFKIAQLFCYGIPVGLTFNVWSRFDPEAATRDLQRLTDMILLNDEERLQQMGVKVRQALVDELGLLEALNPLPEGASNLRKLAPVIASSPVCARLLRSVAARLVRDLPVLGVLLDPTQPITITDLQIAPDLLGTFQRERLVPELRRQFPNLPDDMLLQMVANLEGVTPPPATQRKHIALDSNGGNLGMDNYLVDEDGVLGLHQPAGMRPGALPPPARPDPSQEIERPAERLSPEDLAVLKRFPP